MECAPVKIQAFFFGLLNAPLIRWRIQSLGRREWKRHLCLTAPQKRTNKNELPCSPSHCVWMSGVDYCVAVCAYFECIHKEKRVVKKNCSFEFSMEKLYLCSQNTHMQKNIHIISVQLCDGGGGLHFFILRCRMRIETFYNHRNNNSNKKWIYSKTTFWRLTFTIRLYFKNNLNLMTVKEHASLCIAKSQKQKQNILDALKKDESALNLPRI